MVLAEAAIATTGGVAGASLAFSLRKIDDYWSNKSSKNYLRRSLLAELASMDEFVCESPRDHSESLHAHSFIPTEVYRSNSDRLGILDKAEARAVIRFYTGGLLLERSIEIAHQLRKDDEVEEDFTSINNSNDVIKEDWKTAVLELVSHLDTYQKEVTVDGKTISFTESSSPEELWFALKAEHSGDT